MIVLPLNGHIRGESGFGLGPLIWQGVWDHLVPNT